MMKKTLLAATLFSLGMGVAMADTPKGVARVLADTSIPMAQAVTKVESSLKARVYEAELEDEIRGPIWEIKALTDKNTIVKAYVDAKTGEILKTQERKPRDGKRPPRPGDRPNPEKGRPI